MSQKISPVFNNNALIWSVLAIFLTLNCLESAVEFDDTAALENNEARSNDDEAGEEYTPFDTGKSDYSGFSNQLLQYSRACESGSTLTIAAVGDILLHSPLQKQAMQNELQFKSLWSSVEDLLKQADITYANLEGPTATGVNKSGQEVRDPGLVFDNVVYTSYPMFNYHTNLIDDLMASGIDMVSTANNHALDRWSLGADKTIEALDEAGLAHVGTRKAADTTALWYNITETKGFRLAWISCTFSTNGIPDRKGQVLDCYQDKAEIIETIGQLAADKKNDAIIVIPHWGVEYQASPQRQEINLAHAFLDAGALIVLGGHPHVLQPWEKYVTADGRETFVIYSLGNFVSGQSQLARKSTILLYLGLTRFADGKVGLNGVRYVPMYMTQGTGKNSVVAIDRTNGYTDSRTLTTRMFGEGNILPPSDPLITNPQCD